MITKEMIENEKGYYAKHFAMDGSLIIQDLMKVKNALVFYKNCLELVVI